MSADIFSVPADILRDVHERAGGLETEGVGSSKAARNEEENEMSPYGPGTYFIKLNASGHPGMYAPDGMPIDDPRFESSGNASFFFSLGLDESVAFSEDPMTWRDADGNMMSEPFGNGHRVMEEVRVLILNVTPPVVMPASLPSYHFTLHLNVGDASDVLWASDGSRPLDPTIIEKPPE
jgi:hypothetical protein